MKSNCFHCEYYRDEHRDDGSIRHYCNDLDCTIDPFEPECNYN